MDAPKDPNELLRTLHQPHHGEMQLPYADEVTLQQLIAQIRQGKRAVLIVEDSPDHKTYMFLNGNRPECIEMMSDVISAAAKRWKNGGAQP